MTCCWDFFGVKLSWWKNWFCQSSYFSGHCTNVAQSCMGNLTLRWAQCAWLRGIYPYQFSTCHVNFFIIGKKSSVHELFIVWIYASSLLMQMLKSRYFRPMSVFCLNGFGSRKKNGPLSWNKKNVLGTHIPLDAPAKSSHWYHVATGRQFFLV